jgi:hypothetical protein
LLESQIQNLIGSIRRAADPNQHNNLYLALELLAVAEKLVEPMSQEFFELVGVRSEILIRHGRQVLDERIRLAWALEQCELYDYSVELRAELRSWLRVATHASPDA